MISTLNKYKVLLIPYIEKWKHSNQVDYLFDNNLFYLVYRVNQLSKLFPEEEYWKELLYYINKKYAIFI